MHKKDYMIIIIGILVGLLLANIFLFADTFQGTSIDSVKASQYGSFVGGYFGTFFSFLSIIILFITLRLQRESSEIEKFENKFFNLINLHRDNVKEIGIGESQGRKVFVLILREFRLILKIVNELTDIDIISKLDISYLVLYYGVGLNSSRILSQSLSSYPEELVNKIVKRFEDELKFTKRKPHKLLKYTPFEGHQSRLGHYYRHLYQSVKFVDNHKNIEGYNYIKILRAQLSNHEQVLLLLNSISQLGKQWKNNGYIEKYNIIKNIPNNFLDGNTEINIKQIYPSIMFEWEQN